MPARQSKPNRRRVPALSAAIGCGVDVVELSRFRKAMNRGGDSFLRRVFTDREVAYARARKARADLHLAGRFAAKEAVIKAVSQLNPKRVLAMNKVEIQNDRFGRPHIVLHDSQLRQIRAYISLSHVKSVAVASAIAIK